MGAISAVLHARLKLPVGIPGKSALCWLSPILVARWLTAIRCGATISSTSAAAGLCLIGGMSPRWPLLPTFATFWLVGPILDGYIWVLRRCSKGSASERHRLGVPFAPLFTVLSGVLGNYAHLGLKLSFGVFRPHAPLFGLSAVTLPLVTYFIFGLASGVLAYGAVRPFAATGWRTPRGKADKHDGFTLIELMVTTTIIALLSGLLLPAIFMTREKARRITCAKNLRETALGLEMYCSSYAGYFPSWHGCGSLEEDVRYFDRHGTGRVPDVADLEKPGIHDMRALGTAKNEQKTGNPKWKPEDLARCPINLGFLMISGIIQDGMIFRCPSSGMAGGSAIWKKIGGCGPEALLYGYDAGGDKQQPHVKGSYNYRNAAIDLNADARHVMPLTKPEVTAHPNCPPFKTQRILGARAVCCDSFDRTFVDGSQDDNVLPGRGEYAHRDGYNVLYGDWHVSWFADPQRQIAWYWPEYRATGAGNPDPCHDWIDRSNLGSHEVWHLFDVRCEIDLH